MNKIDKIQNHLDKYEQIFKLLNQLTFSPKINYQEFSNFINSLNNNHQIYVYLIDNKIVGMVTLLIERKLIHSGRYVAHIEDLVTDVYYRGKGIAKALINHLIYISKGNNCYKIILDCKTELIDFYSKLGFNVSSNQMRLDL